MIETDDKTKNELFDGSGNDAKFWLRLRTSAKKSEIMVELIDLRMLQIVGKLLDSDITYFKRLINAVAAEFKFFDSRIRVEKVLGERKGAKKAAQDRRKILIGAYIEKMLIEADKTSKPDFLRPWLIKGLDGYLSKQEDRLLFNELLPKLVTLDDISDLI